jgi:hypothetical protein
MRGIATRLRLRSRTGAWLAGVILAGAGIAVGGYAAVAASESHGTPSCAWPLRLQGHQSAGQAGLVRCYLRALAGRDTGALASVADYDLRVRITSADLAHSADARGGLATATFTPNPVDSTSASVTITYADGVQDTLGLLNMIAMGGTPSWRMVIGTDVNPDPAAPHPAQPAPKAT